MEFISGGSLRGVLDTRPPPLPCALVWARQLLAGLRAIHDAGVVHCDIKPENILLRRNRSRISELVIADFGCATLVNDPAQRCGSGLNGSILYMAPEQLVGSKVDERTDLYAFGLLLYEMLTGALPFAKSGPQLTVVRRLHEAPEPPSKFCPQLSRHLDELVLQCLDRDPNARYPNARWAQRALDG